MLISTEEIAPSEIFASFIRCYSLRKFNTGEQILIKPCHASHEISLLFFLKEKPLYLIHAESRQIIQVGRNIDLIGPSTRYAGDMVFKGDYAFFEILFKANGFFRLFNISPVEVVGQIIHSGEIFDRTLDFLYEQIKSYGCLPQMAAAAENWLQDHYNRQKSFAALDAISNIVNLIDQSRYSLPVTELASQVYMSRRNFERKFTEQVGIPPKVYERIVRFNKALYLKLKNNSESWTSIAHMCGYFDQMHLIKEFKELAGHTPYKFLLLTSLTQEHFISRIEE